MVDSRRKGAAFERSVVKTINGFAMEHDLPFTCKRNLDQYQVRNECDIPIPYHAIECKHYNSGNWLKPAWWKQVCEASNGSIPVLIFKFNRVPPRVCVPLYAINPEMERTNDITAVLPMDDWLYLLKTNWTQYETMK